MRLEDRLLATPNHPRSDLHKLETPCSHAAAQERGHALRNSDSVAVPTEKSIGPQSAYADRLLNDVFFLEVPL